MLPSRNDASKFPIPILLTLTENGRRTRYLPFPKSSIHTDSTGERMSAEALSGGLAEMAPVGMRTIRRQFVGHFWRHRERFVGEAYLDVATGGRPSQNPFTSMKRQLASRVNPNVIFFAMKHPHAQNSTWYPFIFARPV